MKNKSRSLEDIIAGTISMLILVAHTLFFLLGLIGAIVYFSWYSIILIPFCIIMLIGGTGFSLMLMFSKEMQDQCRETWKQANDVE